MFKEFKVKKTAFNAGGFHGDKSPLNDGLECGRSMVEMLGVLAIIGVLSVGGIAGYRMAMEKHYENQVLNAWNMTAVMFYDLVNTTPANKDAGLDYNFGNGISVAIDALSCELSENDMCGAYGLSKSHYANITFTFNKPLPIEGCKKLTAEIAKAGMSDFANNVRLNTWESAHCSSDLSDISNACTVEANDLTVDLGC